MGSRYPTLATKEIARTEHEVMWRSMHPDNNGRDPFDSRAWGMQGPMFASKYVREWIGQTIDPLGGKRLLQDPSRNANKTSCVDMGW